MSEPYAEARQGWIAEYQPDLITPARKGKVVHADPDCPSLCRTADTRGSSIRRAMMFELELMPKCQRCW